jgi:hypothetical protein
MPHQVTYNWSGLVCRPHLLARGGGVLHLVREPLHAGLELGLDRHVLLLLHTQHTSTNTIATINTNVSIIIIILIILIIIIIIILPLPTLRSASEVWLSSTSSDRFCL